MFNKHPKWILLSDRFGKYCLDSFDRAFHFSFSIILSHQNRALSLEEKKALLVQTKARAILYQYIFLLPEISTMYLHIFPLPIQVLQKFLLLH